MRKPNEVRVAVELLQQMLARGNESRPFRVIKGPDPKARIIDAHPGHDGQVGAHYVTLVYDRPVDEPTMQALDFRRQVDELIAAVRESDGDLLAFGRIRAALAAIDQAVTPS